MSKEKNEGLALEATKREAFLILDQYCGYAYPASEFGDAQDWGALATELEQSIYQLREGAKLLSRVKRRCEQESGER